MPGPMKLHVSEYAKAIVGAVTAALSVLAGAVGDGVSAEEWITTACAALVAFSVVFGVPNRPVAGDVRKAGVSEQAPDAGHADSGLLVGLIVGVIGTLVVLLIAGRL